MTHGEDQQTPDGQVPSEQEAAELYRIALEAISRLRARRPDAEDAAQTVMRKLIQSWDAPHVVQARLRGSGPWHGYVRKAARHAYFDLRRTKARMETRERKATVDCDGEPMAERPGTHRRPIDSASELDRYLARQLVADTIDEVLDGRRREVIRLHVLDRHSSKEIAELLGISVRTANQHKSEGLEALRRALLNDDPNE